MEMLLWRIIILAPAAFMVLYYQKKKTRQLVAAAVAYTFFVAACLIALTKDDDQIATAEQIPVDFEYCINQDSTQNRDDVADCYQQLLNSKAMYDREYK